MILARRQWVIATVAAALMIWGGCARDGVPRMVEVNGYRVQMLLQGHGSPAVVFINVGFGGSFKTWDRVNPAISGFTRTVAYNRGGTWKSDPAPLPRDSQHIADELHIALRNAGVKPPYIVVGHRSEASMRGFSPTRTLRTSLGSCFLIRRLKTSSVN